MAVARESRVRVRVSVENSTARTTPHPRGPVRSHMHYYHRPRLHLLASFALFVSLSASFSFSFSFPFSFPFPIPFSFPSPASSGGGTTWEKHTRPGWSRSLLSARSMSNWSGSSRSGARTTLIDGDCGRNGDRGRGVLDREGALEIGMGLLGLDDLVMVKSRRDDPAGYGLDLKRAGLGRLGTGAGMRVGADESVTRRTRRFGSGRGSSLSAEDEDSNTSTGEGSVLKLGRYGCAACLAEMRRGGEACRAILRSTSETRSTSISSDGAGRSARRGCVGVLGDWALERAWTGIGADGEAAADADADADAAAAARTLAAARTDVAAEREAERVLATSPSLPAEAFSFSRSSRVNSERSASERGGDADCVLALGRASGNGCWIWIIVNRRERVSVKSRDKGIVGMMDGIEPPSCQPFTVGVSLPVPSPPPADDAHVHADGRGPACIQQLEVGDEHAQTSQATPPGWSLFVRRLARPSSARLFAHAGNKSLGQADAPPADLASSTPHPTIHQYARQSPSACLVIHPVAS